jgi:hypothetical protein
VPIYQSINNSQSNSPIKRRYNFKLTNNNQISLANSILYGDKLCDQIDPFHGKVIFYYIVPQLVFLTIYSLFSNRQDPYYSHMNKCLWMWIILDLCYNLVSKNDFRSYFLHTRNDLIVKNIYKFCISIIFFYFFYNFIILPTGEKIKKTYNCKETPFEIFLKSMNEFFKSIDNKSIKLIIQQIFQNQEIPKNLNEELEKFGTFVYKFCIFTLIFNVTYYTIFYLYVQETLKKEQSKIKKMFQLNYHQQTHTFENVNENTAKKLEDIFIN